MARRKTPKVARPTGARRLVELLKDLLIVLLTCSAVFLAWQTPMATHFRGWVAPVTTVVQDPTFPNEDALTPYALRVTNSMGSYGVSYDAAALSRVFQRLSPFLGEAFSTAESPAVLPQRNWRTLLESPGIYCAFQGKIPLSVLSAWLGVGESLTGQAEALVLARDGDRFILAWRDGASCYSAPTQLAYDAAVSQVLEDFSPNGAAFAYALAADDDAYSALDLYVLLPVSTPRPQVYTAASPDLVGDRAALARLLTALDFLSGTDSAYETPGGLTVTENGDRLQVSPSGKLTYRAGEEARYPISSSSGSPTASQAAQAAWDLLSQAVEPFEDLPDYVLTGAEETESGWAITFEARLNGIPVSTGETGWCARMVTEGNKISEFTLILRTYDPPGSTTLIPSPRLAAAALRSMTGTDGKLRLSYSDNLSATLTAGWMTGE